jgi:hypothetical protein
VINNPRREIEDVLLAVAAVREASRGLHHADLGGPSAFIIPVAEWQALMRASNRLYSCLEFVECSNSQRTDESRIYN